MTSEFKEEVREYVNQIRREVIVKEEILERMVALFLSLKRGQFPSKKPPRGLLFYGPPGTGKTLLMKILAKKLGLSEPIVIRGPEIISQYYGKSEARLRQIFSLAKERAKEENLAMIFIDELDSLAPRRDIAKGELETRLVGQLLSLMDGLEKEASNGHVVVIGSTNRPDALDPALRRPGRFDLEVEFDPPTVSERKEILKILLDNYANIPAFQANQHIDLDDIAEQTTGFTGADLLQLLNEGLLQATLEGRNYVTQEDLEKAKNNVKPSVLREFHIEMPKDQTNEISNEDIRKKIEDIADDFCKRCSFKPVLLRMQLPLANRIASTIAWKTSTRLKGCLFLVARANWFRTKWFGEMERSIREFFAKISRSQPCVAYIRNVDAIARSENEHLHGALAELQDNLTDFKDNDAKVLLLCSATSEIDPEIGSFFVERIDS